MAQIRTDGLFQGDLITFIDNALTMMTEFKADFNAVLTKLDGDTLVGDTNYNSTLAISGTVPTRSATINGTGIYAGDLYTLLSSMATFAASCKTQMAALLTKLDADSGVTDTNYATTCVTSTSAPTVGSMSSCAIPKGAAMAFCIAMADFFTELKTDYTALLTKLDADTGVTLTTYLSGNPIAASLSTTV